MKIELFRELKQKVIEAGYADEIVWAENIKCRHSTDFFAEYVWVVISSGMKNQVAKRIYIKVMAAIIDKVPIQDVFGHAGKVKAIYYVAANLKELYLEYRMAGNKVEFLKGLPWIGDITKWHLAKNLGLDVVKPDRHLTRIAEGYGTTPAKMCERLAKEVGCRVATVDQIIWRAANLGFV